MQKWLAQSCEATHQYVDVEGVVSSSTMVLHPYNDVVVVNTKRDLLCYSAINLQLLHKYNVIDEGVEYGIFDVTISQDGTKCVVAKKNSGTTEVFDISDMEHITTLTSYTMKYFMSSSDISSDGEHVLSAGEVGINMWNLSTSQLVNILSEGWTLYARFMNDDTILYVRYYDGQLHMMKVDGSHLHTFNGKLADIRAFVLCNNSSRLITGNRDNSIRLYDVSTGETLYTFFHPSTEGFMCFAVHGDIVYAGNKNGKVYMFKTSLISLKSM